MKLTSHVIKAAVAAYWRYTRQCSIVAFECDTQLRGGELADVLVVNDDRRLIIIEVKVSLGDFKRDRRKMYHEQLRLTDGKQESPKNVFDRSFGTKIRPVEYFYFAVPKDLANKVSLLCDQLFPYAGVLGCSGVRDNDTYVYRKPKRFECCQLNNEQIEDITRAQTATLCRLARKVAEEHQIRKELEARLLECRPTIRSDENEPDS